MHILAVITARGDSTTLPRKNILPFCDKPLIAYTIEAALAAQRAGAPIDRIVVSTDNAEIAKISCQFGAEVPFMRPPELARADTPSLPVIEHAVTCAETERGLRYDWILLLQPTSPLRTGEDILHALDLIKQPGTTAVISITSANTHHPKKLRLIEDGVLMPFQEGGFEPSRRQDFGVDVYKTNGAIYLARRDILMEDRSFYGSCPRPLMMPPERSIDIDTRLDFDIAEFLYRRSTNEAARLAP
jgi:CMP-N,N'-diacetyllegionaminic acid synthase